MDSDDDYEYYDEKVYSQIIYPHKTPDQDQRAELVKDQDEEYLKALTIDIEKKERKEQLEKEQLEKEQLEKEQLEKELPEPEKPKISVAELRQRRIAYLEKKASS